MLLAPESAASAGIRGRQRGSSRPQHPPATFSSGRRAKVVSGCSAPPAARARTVLVASAAPSLDHHLESTTSSATPPATAAAATATAASGLSASGCDAVPLQQQRQQGPGEREVDATRPGEPQAALLRESDSTAHARRYADLSARITLERLYRRGAQPRSHSSSSTHSHAASLLHRQAGAGGASQTQLFSDQRTACPPGSSVGASRQEAVAQVVEGGQVLSVSTEEKPPSQKQRNEGRSPDYFANVGDAIRTLREDIPELFARELNYDIYREDIVFKDPRVSLEGIKNYKRLFWSLRASGRIFFSKLYVEVKRIWQPTDGVIKMRWTVHGVPRVPWDAEGLFDGISTYKLDNNGKVYEHSVDNVLLRDPPAFALNNSPLLSSINLVPNNQLPCPGACTASSDVAPQDQLPQVVPVPVPCVMPVPCVSSRPDHLPHLSSFPSPSLWHSTGTRGSGSCSTSTSTAYAGPTVAPAHPRQQQQQPVIALAASTGASGAAGDAGDAGLASVAGTPVAAELWAEAVRDVDLSFPTAAASTGARSARGPRSASARPHQPSPAAAPLVLQRPAKVTSTGSRGMAVAALAASPRVQHSQPPTAATLHQVQAALPSPPGPAPQQHAKHATAVGAQRSSGGGGAAAGASSWSQQLAWERLHEALEAGADLATGGLSSHQRHAGSAALEPSPSH